MLRQNQFNMIRKIYQKYIWITKFIDRKDKNQRNRFFVGNNVTMQIFPLYH